MTKLISPRNGSLQTIHTPFQSLFYRERWQEDLEEGDKLDWDHLKSTGEDNSSPQKICFQWETELADSAFELSETEDFRNPLLIQTEQKTMEIGNLKADQRYYWRVNGCEPFCFVTDGAPRWIAAGGIVNVRDNGGWKTKDGMRIRQGMLFRGSEMEWQSYHDRDPSKEHHLQITEEGIRVIRKELGVRTDLDLRLAAQGWLLESPLGKDVNLQVIPLLPYYQLWEDHQEEAVKAIFELLADPDAYPIYYHCWGGSDRAGTVAFLLEALLGVSDADMILDYEASSMACWGRRMRSSKNFSRFQERLIPYAPEGNWQERSEKYLMSCGVTPETLQKIRDILLESDFHFSPM